MCFKQINLNGFLKIKNFTKHILFKSFNSNKSKICSYKIDPKDVLDEVRPYFSLKLIQIYLIKKKILEHLSF